MVIDPTPQQLDMKRPSYNCLIHRNNLVGNLRRDYSLPIDITVIKMFNLTKDVIALQCKILNPSSRFESTWVSNSSEDLWVTCRSVTGNGKIKIELFDI